MIEKRIFVRLHRFEIERTYTRKAEFIFGVTLENFEDENLNAFSSTCTLRDFETEASQFFKEYFKSKGLMQDETKKE